MMSSSQPFKIYNASAGAGKTFTLVFEFISILLQKSSPKAFSELLAITFTNKAANEMKERIIKKLQELSQGEVSGDEMHKFEEKTGLSTEQIQEKSGKILHAILHNYALFSVSTIDKFNLRLMRAFSQDMGLSLNFDVEMDVKNVLRESVDVLFSELESGSKFTDLFTNMAIENLGEGKKWDFTDDMTQRAGTLFQDKFLEELKALSEISLETLIEFREKARQKRIEHEQYIVNKSTEILDFFESNGLTINNFKGKSRGSVIKYYQGLQDKKFVLYTPTQEKYVAKNTILDANHPLEETVGDFLNGIYPDIKENIIHLNFWDKVYKNINPITSLNEIDKKLNEIKKENNILLISEFNKIISQNIKDEPAPYIYLKIGNRYTNYFIDEFQDTSNLQWDNLIPLVENTLASNHQVMIVGDPKQSIYRFRGGNPQLMIDLHQSKDPRIAAEELPKNWRSYETVIQFNNELYTQIAQKLDNPQYKKLYQDGNKQQTNHKKGGYVQINYLEKPKRGSGENFLSDVIIPILIRNIQKSKEAGFDYDEMAILIRQKNEGRKIAEALSEQGIKVISNESLLLINAQEIQLLLAFIKFINDTENNQFKADFLLQLMFNELLNIEHQNEFIFDIIRLNTNQFIEKLLDIGLDIRFIQLPFTTLYDRVASAIRAFGLDKEGNSYITFFMDEILTFQQKGNISAAQFLDFWEVKGADLSISVPESNDAIQLMTIHKSKGLEFPVVFLPTATWSSKADGVWLPIAEDGIEKIYVEGVKSQDILPDNLLPQIIEEESNAQLDALNVLYVATTRAVEQLYISTELLTKTTTSDVSNYLNDFKLNYPLNEDNAIILGDITRVSNKKEKVRSLQNLSNISTDWTQKVMISKEHALLWNEERAQSIDYGNKMHAVLEKINHVDETEEILNQFELQGFISSDEKTMISEELQKLFGHPDLYQIFQQTEFYNERDFVSREGKLFRPDRLVKMGEQWVLLDYKTGQKRNKHRQQINSYADNLESLGFSVAQKILIYPGNPDGLVFVD